MKEAEPQVKPVEIKQPVVKQDLPDIDDLLDRREKNDFPLDDYEDLGTYLEPYQND
jgi:hypothetical protein